MAATITTFTDGGGFKNLQRVGSMGDKLYTHFFKVTGDTSYPTGGYDVSVQVDPWFSTVLGAVDGGKGSHTYEYDIATKKVKFFSGGSEVAATTNVSTISVTLGLIGLGH